MKTFKALRVNSCTVGRREGWGKGRREDEWSMISAKMHIRGLVSPWVLVDMRNYLLVGILENQRLACGSIPGLI